MSFLVNQQEEINYYSNLYLITKTSIYKTRLNLIKKIALKHSQKIPGKYLPKESTFNVSIDYYQKMTDLYLSSSSVSPFTAIIWCLYPIAVLVIIELILGGGFDDDNNDDQDGGMLIPAYSNSKAQPHL